MSRFQGNSSFYSFIEISQTLRATIKGLLMNKINFLAVAGVLLSNVLTACQSSYSPGADRMLTVTQPAEATPMLKQSTLVLEPYASPAAVIESAVTPDIVTIQTGSASFQLDPDYFKGLIILTEYYTLLDHGLYEESYQLLSAAQQKRTSFEDYVAYHSTDTKALEIKGILPYNYDRIQKGLPARQIPPGELRYFVFVTIYHNGLTWNKGSIPMPDDKTGFQALVLENNEWKVDKFNTSPWLQ
jgi:hypothetical protein